VAGVYELCKALEVAPATYFRSHDVKTSPVKRRSIRALTDEEKDFVLKLLNDEKYVDMSVSQVFHHLLDKGQYYCSVSKMYSILRENKAVKERRDQRRHPKYVKPVLKATGPNQVWSWDITKLKGPNKGEYFNLYSIIDIYSRMTVGWTVSPYENGTVARDLIEQTCLKHKVKREQLVIHSDRGSPMKSKTVSELMMDLGVLKSFSRPRVSNDNPFSEAQFKTLKYHRTFPKVFGCVQDARNYLRRFFDWYNNEHFHSGIAMLPPASVHFGFSDQIIEKRTHTMKSAFKKHPERFVKGKTTTRSVPSESWINQPCQNVLEAA
jgi:putative transposase